MALVAVVAFFVVGSGDDDSADVATGGARPSTTVAGGSPSTSRPDRTSTTAATAMFETVFDCRASLAGLLASTDLGEGWRADDEPAPDCSEGETEPLCPALAINATVPPAVESFASFTNATGAVAVSNVKGYETVAAAVKAMGLARAAMEGTCETFETSDADGTLTIVPAGPEGDEQERVVVTLERRDTATDGRASKVVGELVYLRIGTVVAVVGYVDPGLREDAFMRGLVERQYEQVIGAERAARNKGTS